MANQIATVNGIAIASIANINGITDANLAKLNGREFTSVLPEAHTLIATATASASATLSFTTGIDSTYDAYEFRWTNMHPSSDTVNFQFQVNASGETDFNETMTTTYFRAGKNETTTSAFVAYTESEDQAQGTAYQRIGHLTGSDSDQSTSGVLTLYAPSSTTYVKHFVSMSNTAHAADFSKASHVAGYINTTAAIDEISFAFQSGNIDAGQIKMYGIAKA